MMEHWQQQRTQCLVFEPTISNILNFAAQTVQGMFRYDTDQKYQDFSDYLGKRFRYTEPEQDSLEQQILAVTRDIR